MSPNDRRSIERLAGDESTPDLDRLFAALSDPLRRRILLLLEVQTPEPKLELDVDGIGRSGERRERQCALRHAHLPKLDDAGYVDWKRDRGTVRRGSRFDEAVPLLEYMREHTDELS